MGEWSEYFEDFPEENPGNYVNGRFDPRAAATRRLADAKVAQDQATLDAEIAQIIQQHRQQSPGTK